MVYRLGTCCDLFPNRKEIKQSWLTEPKTLGYFLLGGVSDKALPSESSHFIRLQITVPEEVLLP